MSWFDGNTHHWDDWTLDALVAAKGDDQGQPGRAGPQRGRHGR